MHRENQQIHAQANLYRQWRINGPAGIDRNTRARNELHEQRCQQQYGRGRQQPEAHIVHAWQRHVRRADHHRNHPVGHAGGGRHDHAEDHDQRVVGNQVVIQIRIDDLQAGHKQLGANQHGHGAADKQHHQGKDQVHGTDILVVGAV